MKKVISATLTVVLAILMAVNVFASSADDWRGKFISDNSGTFYNSFGTKCFLTKPDDMPDYIYAVYNDASMSSDILSVLGGDATAIANYNELKKTMDSFSSVYYDIVQGYNPNGHFVMALLNPLNSDKLLYVSTDGVATYDAMKEQQATGSETPSETPSESAGTETYDLDLSAGHYKGGLGIPTGTYTLTWVANSGNVYSPLKVNEIFREDRTTTYNNFEFSEGTELKVSGNLIVHIHSDNADFSKVKQREITTEVETVLAPGNYTAGTDFPEGTYFIQAYEGSGNVHSYEADVNEIINVEPNGHGIYQYNYATFKTGYPLEVSGCTIKLVPAGE